MTIKDWCYIFDRHNQWQILLDSLRYCQKQKEVKIYSWVFMLNHLHLIASCPDMIGFVRDFKKFTSKELKKNILATEPNILSLFEENGEYHFWQPSNMPKPMENEGLFWQKKQYIENNPVRKQYVKNPENWLYYSANGDSLLVLSDPET